MQHADRGDHRRGGCRDQYRRRGTAVGVRVGAPPVGASWIVRVVVTAGSDTSDIVLVIVPDTVFVIVHGGSIHLLVRQCVRAGELRGMQDRHLAATQHGNGKQGCDHDVFDDPAHGPSKRVCLRPVKRGCRQKICGPSFVRQSRIGM